MKSEGTTSDADLAVSPPRRSPEWGLFFIIIGILVIPAAFIVVSAPGIANASLKNEALREMQRDDLSGDERFRWSNIAKEAEAAEEKEKEQEQRKRMFLQFVVLPFASALLLLGRRLRAPDVYKLTERDVRPYILYLRSFATDRVNWDWRLILRSDEEKLLKLLRRMGPAIALGRPGERLAQLGSVRIYVSEHCWRKVVDKLLVNAGLVVLRASNTPGLFWEMQRVREVLLPQQVILLNPFSGNPKGFEGLRRDVGELMHITIPGECRNEKLIGFGDNWLPHPISMTKSLHALPEVVSEPALPLRTSAPTPLLNRIPLRHILADLSIEEAPGPPFRVHWLTVLPGAVLASLLIKQSVSAGTMEIWPTIAMRGIELLALLVAGLGASFYLWLYMTQKRLLLSLCLGFVVSVPLAWNVFSLSRALVKEKGRQVEVSEAQQRMDIYRAVDLAYRRWFREHDRDILESVETRSDGLLPGDLTRALETAAIVAPETRKLAEEIINIFEETGETTIRYRNAVQQLSASGGPAHRSLTSRLDLEHRLINLQYVQARLEDLQTSLRVSDDRARVILGGEAFPDLDAVQVHDLLDIQSQFWKVTDSLLRLLLDESAHWRFNPKSREPELKVPDLSDRIEVLAEQQRGLAIRWAVYCQILSPRQWSLCVNPGW